MAVGVHLVGHASAVIVLGIGKDEAGGARLHAAAALCVRGKRKREGQGKEHVLDAPILRLFSARKVESEYKE